MTPKGSILLPPSKGDGGFDHAAIHRGRSLLYVAHTANNALDVIDLATRRYLYSIENLAGVAGALVSEEYDRVFTSNRGEDTVSIFEAGARSGGTKIPVCSRPNGLAFNPARGTLLVAGVGEPFHLSLVNVDTQQVGATVSAPGRTRWTLYDNSTDAFYVNVANPAVIAVLNGSDPREIERMIPVPAKGPHGLEIDAGSEHLYCACDEGLCLKIEISSGRVVARALLSGVPDVIWYNARLDHLYVAIGEPGIVEVFDGANLGPIERVRTELGAHTTGFDSGTNMLFAFLPDTSRAAVFVDD